MKINKYKNILDFISDDNMDFFFTKTIYYTYKENQKCIFFYDEQKPKYT